MFTKVSLIFVDCSSTVRVGDYNLTSELDCDKDGWCSPPPQDIAPAKIFIHPDYNRPNKFQHDIAIILLDREVEVNDYVSPVCLPIAGMLPHTIDMDPEVAGWGAVDMLARRFSDVLRYVFVPFSDMDQCSNIYKMQRMKIGTWKVVH